MEGLTDLGKDIKDFEVIEPISKDTPGVEVHEMTQEEIAKWQEDAQKWEEERYRQEQEAAEKHKEDYIRTIIDLDNPRELTDVLRKIAEELYNLKMGKEDRTVYLR